MVKYLLEFNATDNYDVVYSDVMTAMNSLIPCEGDWTLTKHVDVPTQLREVLTRLDKLETRLQGVIETHHLWDGS